MKINTYQFKKAPVAVAIESIAADAANSVTNFAWHDVFYAGTHTDMNGNVRTFTRADLEQIVANFEKDKVPYVIGHPNIDAPAYGWASAARVTDDNRIEVQAENVNVVFAKAVAAKAFPNRSVRVNNGPNGWHLEHIGYLGAIPPALEGMPWQFAEHNPDAVYEYALDKWSANIIVRFMRRLRELTIQDKSLEEADKLVPEWELEELSDAIKAESRVISEATEVTPQYSQNPQETDVTTFTKEQLDAAVKQAADAAVQEASVSFATKLNDMEKRASDAEAALTAAKEVEQKAAFATAVAKAQVTVDGLITAGTLVPSQTEGLAQFMAHLSNAQDAEFSFSQGDKETTETPFAFATRFVESLGKTKSPAGDPPEFDNIDNTDLDTRATAYAKENKCSYVDAVAAVSQA